LVERKTGLPFAVAVDRLVFQPNGMAASGEDDDGLAPSGAVALGYAPEGVYGLVPAQTIHWSAKSGNGSAYTTAKDVATWIDALFAGKALSARSTAAVLNPMHTVGFGWFRRRLDRFDEVAYYMNGRAPGFASFAMYLPKERLTVVVLSNIYCSATTSIGFDLAAIELGKAYQAFRPSREDPAPERLAASTGTFRFGSDFYASNAELRLVASAGALSLEWPGGSTSPLIPLDADGYMDRSYWENVRIVRDAGGKATGLQYGEFTGVRVSGN
jgi:CubicO group peptidase (beta-lactamase class C family)